MDRQTFEAILKFAEGAMLDDDGLFDGRDSPVELIGRGLSLRESPVVSVASKLASLDVLLACDPKETGPILRVSGVIGPERELLIRELLDGDEPKTVRFLGDPDPADWISFEAVRLCVSKARAPRVVEWLLGDPLANFAELAFNRAAPIRLSEAERLLLRGVESLGCAHEAVSVVGQEMFSLWATDWKIEIEGVRLRSSSQLLAHVRAALRGGDAR